MVIPLSPQMQKALSTSGEGLVETASPVPGGGVMVNLKGRFRSATVGAAGPNTAHGNWDCSVLGTPGCLMPPFPDAWYVQALANSLAGADLDPGTSDIFSAFNPDIGTAGCLESCGWYYGFDRNASGCDIDFTATILHEMGHGLGFVSLVDLDTGEKFGGYDDAYMIHLEDHSTGLHYPFMSKCTHPTRRSTTLQFLTSARACLRTS